jgi:hypothetical protein
MSVWAPLRTARDRTHFLDLVVLFGLPGVLLWVFNLPLSMREAYVFDYASPTPLTAFVSSFVHLDSAHLVLNLVGYALVVPIAYLLSVLSGHRTRFLVAFASMLLAFPLVLPYMNLTIVRDSASVGFSGVLLAFYGYLPMTLADHVETHFDIGSSRNLAPLFFMLGLALIVGLTTLSIARNPVSVPVQGRTVPVTPVLLATLVGLAAAIVLSIVLFGISAVDDPRTLLQKTRATIDSPGYFELFVIATFLFFSFPFATFPVDPVFRGGVLNLYVHLLGYALGFIATYATVQVGRRYFGDSSWL